MGGLIQGKHNIFF